MDFARRTRAGYTEFRIPLPLVESVVSSFIRGFCITRFLPSSFRRGILLSFLAVWNYALWLISRSRKRVFLLPLSPSLSLSLSVCLSVSFSFSIFSLISIYSWKTLAITRYVTKAESDTVDEITRSKRDAVSQCGSCCCAISRINT